MEAPRLNVLLLLAPSPAMIEMPPQAYIVLTL